MNQAAKDRGLPSFYTINDHQLWFNQEEIKSAQDRLRLLGVMRWSIAGNSEISDLTTIQHIMVKGFQIEVDGVMFMGKDAYDVVSDVNMAAPSVYTFCGKMYKAGQMIGETGLIGQEEEETSIVVDGHASQMADAASSAKKRDRRGKRNVVEQVLTIQRAWRANAAKLRRKRVVRERQSASNIIFQGEFALSNHDNYEKYIDVEEGAAGTPLGEADLGSIDDSDAESQLVSLSLI